MYPAQNVRWFGLSACLLLGLTATAHAQLRVRPEFLCPVDGYCCPYGLGQWEGRPHRYIHGDGPCSSLDNGGDAPDSEAVLTGDTDREVVEHQPADQEIAAPLLSAPALPAVGTQHQAMDFYNDIDESNFECTRCRRDESYRSESAVEAEECPRECDMCSDVTLDQAIADGRHSAGQWIVHNLNAEQDGLDGTRALELDWAAIARGEGCSEAAGDQQPAGFDVKSEAAAEDCPEAGNADDAKEEDTKEEDAEGGKDDGIDGVWRSSRRTHWMMPQDECPRLDTSASPAVEEPGAFRDWCGQVWQTVREKAEEVSREVLTWANRENPSSLMDESRPVGPCFGQTGQEEAAPPVGEANAVEEMNRPAPQQPLPNYFLPAFGSPWDGDL